MKPREIRKHQRQERRRRDLVEAAIAVIETIGTAELTMEHVAARAGVSKPSVYYYFANKDDVLRAVAVAATAQYARDTAAAIRGLQGAAAADAMVRHTVAAYRDRLELFRAVHLWCQVREIARAETLEAVNSEMNALFDTLEAALAKTAPPGVHPRRLAFTVWSSAFGLLSAFSLFEASGTSSRHALDDLLDETCGMVRRAVGGYNSAR